MMLSVPRWENPWVVVAFLIFTGSAFGMNLLVILIATLCCLWGPVKALFSYFISSIMVTWLFFDRLGALLTTG